MKVEIVTITPEMAEEMLTHNSTMFNKQAQRINQYQKLMQQKRDELRGKGGEA